eukprot:s1316_g10.t1
MTATVETFVALNRATREQRRSFFGQSNGSPIRPALKQSRLKKAVTGLTEITCRPARPAPQPRRLRRRREVLFAYPEEMGNGTTPVLAEEFLGISLDRQGTLRFYLRKLDQPCNQTLGGRFASFFEEPPRGPRFKYLSPRDKTLESPRLPGALHALYRQPEAQAVIANAWSKRTWEVCLVEEVKRVDFRQVEVLILGAQVKEPAVCKGLCTRAAKRGYIAFCDSCAEQRRCPICRPNHEIDKAAAGIPRWLPRSGLPTVLQKDFEWFDCKSFTRQSVSEVVEAPPGLSIIEEEIEKGPSWTGTPSPRKYQWEAFRQVCEQNTIVNMDTGLGKTLIAVMSIDHFIRQQKDKKVLVCVTTIALANQQTQVIQQQSTVPGLRVVAVTSKITKHTPEWWQQLKDDYQVFVGIGAIFQQALLQRAFLRLSELSLIVFDECHNAVGGHPFVKDSVEWKNRQQPRVLGLTASYLNGRTGDLLNRRRKLEETLRSQIWCPKEEHIKDYLLERSYTTMSYGGESDELKELQEKCGQSLEKMLQGYSSREGSPLWDCREDLKKQQAIAQRCFKEAGFYGWRAFLKVKLLPAVYQRLQDKKHDRFHLTQAEDCHCVARQMGQEMRCIIFVEQVDDTYPLSKIIDQHMKRHMTRYVAGKRVMSETQQHQALQDFRDGVAPILVATPAIEEGLDVASCNAVIRYHSFHTTKSHIQGAGRARKASAKIFYFENDWKEED